MQAETLHNKELCHDCTKDLSTSIAKMMGISGKIRRMDSMMIESNIRKLSRREKPLCVLRFWKPADRCFFPEGLRSSMRKKGARSSWNFSWSCCRRNFCCEKKNDVEGWLSAPRFRFTKHWTATVIKKWRFLPLLVGKNWKRWILFRKRRIWCCTGRYESVRLIWRSQLVWKPVIWDIRQNSAPSQSWCWNCRKRAETGHWNASWKSYGDWICSSWMNGDMSQWIRKDTNCCFVWYLTVTRARAWSWRKIWNSPDREESSPMIRWQ